MDHPFHSLLYYTRPVGSARVLLAVVVIASGAAGPAAMQARPATVVASHGEASARLLALTQGYELREEQIADGSEVPLRLKLMVRPEAAGRATRLREATTLALVRLREWYGPFPRRELTVVDWRWDKDPVDALMPGVIVVATRLLEPASDLGLERTVIAALARQYWLVSSGSNLSQRRLGAGLAVYAGVRGIHEALEGRNFSTQRFFGGFVPHINRSILWSPSPIEPRPKLRYFAEVERSSEVAWRMAGVSMGEAMGVALALHTLERYLGPPAMQQAMEALQLRWQAGVVGLDDLAAIVSEQRGTDMRWFFDEAVRIDAIFDYGIASFSSEPRPSPPGEFETRVSLRRFGNGVFSGTSEPRAPLQAGRSLKVRTFFENGEAVDDWWDGRDATMDLVYRGPARAVLSSVDPEAMLLLDADRSNNTRVSTVQSTEIGARLTAFWLLWLQDVMLVSSALL